MDPEKGNPTGKSYEILQLNPQMSVLLASASCISPSHVTGCHDVESYKDFALEEHFSFLLNISSQWRHCKGTINLFDNLQLYDRIRTNYFGLFSILERSLEQGVRKKITNTPFLAALLDNRILHRMHSAICGCCASCVLQK